MTHLSAHALSELEDFLRIPSISGQKSHQSDMRAACLWLKSKLKDLGFKAEVMPTSSHPVVFGQRLDAGADKPTILIYGHYDVQSPDPLELWESPPFEPDKRNGNLYARGVADDKGQLYAWIAAIEALLSEDNKLPVNIKFLIEGAEEEGSEGLDEFVAENKDLLRADSCVISDSHNLSPDQPLICYGLRGLYYGEVVVRTLDRDAHSGIYGGNVLNAALELTKILSQLKDKNERILIPGIYQSVRKLTRAEHQELAAFPWSEADIKAETGASVVTGELGFNIAERAGARPTIEIHGLDSGYQGEGGKTIIPARAKAKLSLRLVPHQQPEEVHVLLLKYLQSLTPPGVSLELVQVTSSLPVILNRDDKYFAAAEAAYTNVFGTAPIYELSGGSIGVVAMLQHHLHIDSVLMGFGLPDDGLHSPNEKMSLTMLDKGVATAQEFLRLLG